MNTIALRSLRPGLVALCAILGCAAAALAAPPAPAPHSAALLRAFHPRAWYPPITSGPGAAGMRVQIQPESGRLEPAGPDQALPVESVRIGAAPYVERLANGSLLAHLNGQFDEYMVARKDANGRPQLECLDSRKDAEAAMRRPAPVIVREVK